MERNDFMSQEITTTKGNQMIVTENNVFARLKRHYAKHGLSLKKCRDGKWIQTTGRYGLVDDSNNTWVDHHIDLEQRAREEGVLLPMESIAE